MKNTAKHSIEADRDALNDSMKPIRLALFTGNYHHVADGVALTLNRWVRWLEETKGIPVMVIAPEVSDPQIKEHFGELVGIPSIPMPGRPEYRFAKGFPKSVRKKLEAFNPTIVHVATPDYAGTGGMLWARKRGIPVVSSFHTHFVSYTEYYKISFLDPFLWAYARWFYKRVQEVYVPSESMKDVLKEHGISSDIKIWARGVETGLFSPEKRDPTFRESIGATENAPVISFVSRLVLEKETRTVVEVFKKIHQTDANVRFLIVGDGPARAEMEAALPYAAFTGYLKGEDLARAYASSDVFFFPSLTETFGNVTLEALASGLPAVVADASGSKSIVQHGQCGFILPPKNIDLFAERLLFLANNQASRAAMSVAARKRALEFSWPVIHETLFDRYKALINPEAEGAAT